MQIGNKNNTLIRTIGDKLAGHALKTIGDKVVRGISKKSPVLGVIAEAGMEHGIRNISNSLDVYHEPLKGDYKLPSRPRVFNIEKPKREEPDNMSKHFV